MNAFLHLGLAMVIFVLAGCESPPKTQADAQQGYGHAGDEEHRSFRLRKRCNLAGRVRQEVFEVVEENKRIESIEQSSEDFPYILSRESVS